MAELRRELTAADGIALVIGITMGVGIFAVPGRVAAYLPSVGAVVLAWFLAGLAAILGGMIYAELGSRLPQTGGEYVYLHKAFGPAVSFVYGWTQLLVVRTNPGAALSLVAAEYLEHFVPLSESQRLLVATSILVLLGVANYRGLRPGKRIQMITTVLKVGGCLLFIAAAALWVSDYSGNLSSVHTPPQPHGPIGNFAGAMLLTIFTFLGWDRLGFLAGEMRRPARNIPRVLMWGIGALLAIYLAMNLYYHALMPIGQVSGSTRVASDAAQIVMGPIGAALIAITVIISAAGSTNGTIMSCSRIYYAMAKDGLFLSFMARVHPRYHSPHWAVVAHCGWAILLLLVGRNLETFIGSQVFVILISYAMMTWALMRFRRSQPVGANVYQLPGYPWAPLLFLLLILVMTVTTCIYYPLSALMNSLLVASGVPLYFVWKKKDVTRS